MIRIIDLSKETLQLGALADAVAIITLGGPMNVYEEDKYPFLRQENEFLKKAVKDEIPVLGICLGAQILAKACAAKVKKAKEKEIGWLSVNLTAAGKTAPLFENLPSQLMVFQWHEDTFEIPEGGRLLAKSDLCPHQAFRFGRNAYGLQFHIEVTPEMVESWIYNYIKEEPAVCDTKDMLIAAYKKKEVFRQQAEMIYFNFARIISAS